MSASFLGVGWRFPVALESGRIALAAYEESIREAIWIILATARGERKMRPDFGCGVHDLVFAVQSGETAGRVASEVRQALILWEPRIDVLDVTAGSDESEPTRLLIQIEYRVRATNNRFNLVYPFYLE
ncbi:MAG TPA: GPW/gp25 family protein [Thermoanaerobaculia bacterium]|nr:GPW/gp25 family protein [Thermoanaerobaculia bacterium]